MENINKLRDFKKVCLKIGIVLSIYYISRTLCSVIINSFDWVFSDMGETLSYLIVTIFSVIFSYIIPLFVTIILFNSFDNFKQGLKHFYKKPEKTARVMGNFIAVYGFGQLVNLLTTVAFMIIAFLGSGFSGMEESYETMSSVAPMSFPSACIFAVLAIIIAPIIEEFWVRGILFNALKPFGNGFSIVITAIIFGLMHSNMRSLFFTTALGLALGYITYATGSIFISTIMHSIFNAISTIIIMFMSTEEINYLEQGGTSGGLITVLFYFYMVIVFCALLIGMFSFIKKIKVIKQYRIQNTWSEVKSSKKFIIFFTSLPVIFSIILAVNAHAGEPIVNYIYNFLSEA